MDIINSVRSRLSGKLRSFEKRFLIGVIKYFSSRYDIVKISTKQNDNNFFKVGYDIIKEILKDKKINMLDIGARGGTISKIQKYYDILNQQCPVRFLHA